MGKKKEPLTRDYTKMTFSEIINSCDSTVVKCPKCEHRSICQKIAENHVGKPYQYRDNEFIKKKTINELLADRPI